MLPAVSWPGKSSAWYGHDDRRDPDQRALARGRDHHRAGRGGAYHYSDQRTAIASSSQRAPCQGLVLAFHNFQPTCWNIQCHKFLQMCNSFLSNIFVYLRISMRSTRRWIRLREWRSWGRIWRRLWQACRCSWLIKRTRFLYWRWTFFSSSLSLLFLYCFVHLGGTYATVLVCLFIFLTHRFFGSRCLGSWWHTYSDNALNS